MIHFYTCLAEDFIGWVWSFCGDLLTWYMR